LADGAAFADVDADADAEPPPVSFTMVVVLVQAARASASTATAAPERVRIPDMSPPLPARYATRPPPLYEPGPGRSHKM
jgi:hypothetical protein